MEEAEEGEKRDVFQAKHFTNNTNVPSSEHWWTVGAFGRYSSSAAEIRHPCSFEASPPPPSTHVRGVIIVMCDILGLELA